MDDTSGPGQRRLLALLGVVTLLALIIISGSPTRFLNWVFSLLEALSVLLLFVFVFALVLVMIAALLHRYMRKRRQEELDDQQSAIRATQPIQRGHRNHQPPEE